MCHLIFLVFVFCFSVTRIFSFFFYYPIFLLFGLKKILGGKTNKQRSVWLSTCTDIQQDTCYYAEARENRKSDNCKDVISNNVNNFFNFLKRKVKFPVTSSDILDPNVWSCCCNPTSPKNHRILHPQKRVKSYMPWVNRLMFSKIRHS